MTAQLKLFKAAKDNDEKLTEIALKEGAQLDGRNDQGETALIVAAKNKAENVWGYLLSQKKLNVNIQDYDLRTALHHAVLNQDVPLVMKLRERYAQLDITDCNGDTPLMIAKKLNNTKLIQILTANSSVNYHAEFIQLRSNLKMLSDGEDIITTARYQLARLIPKLETQMQLIAVKLRSEILQPEEMLQFNALALMIQSSQLKLPASSKEASSKLPIEKKESSFITRFKELKTDTSSKQPVTNVSSLAEVNEAIREQFSLINLNEEAPIFDKIKAVIKVLDAYLGDESKKADIKSANSEALFLIISQVKRFYQNYINDVCLRTGDKRLELCQGRTRVYGAFGNHYLSEAVAARLNHFFDKTIPSKRRGTYLNNQVRENDSGSHDVVLLNKAYLKPEATDPLIEEGVTCWSNIISGDKGTAEIDLITIAKGTAWVHVTASNATRGENFFKMLQKDPDCIQYIDPYNFSSHFATDISTCPSDRRHENFNGLDVRDINGKIMRILLTCFDNDMALGEEISVLKAQNSLQKSRHFVELHSVIFLMRQMDYVVDSVFRENYIKQSPVLFVFAWLKEMLEHEKRFLSYCQKQDEKNVDVSSESGGAHIPVEAAKELNIPVKLLPGTIQRMYERTKIFHKALTENPNITHQQLLAKVYPACAKMFEFVRKNRPNVLEASEFLRAKNLPSFEETFPDDLEIKEELKKFNRTYNDIVKEDRTETLIQGCLNFINQLDYSEYNEVVQRLILENIRSDFQFINKLTIRNCQVLDDSFLSKIMRNLHQVEELTLINCSCIEGSGISAVMCDLSHKRNIHIKLQDFVYMSPLNLFYLIRDCKNLTFIMPAGSFNTSKEFDKLLEETLLDDKYINLTTALLFYRAQFGKNPNAPMPLHFACHKGNIALVEKLLQLEVRIDTLNSEKKSALSIACEGFIRSYGDEKLRSNFLKIIILLLDRGALDCDKPNEVLDLVIRHGNILSSRTSCAALFTFACCHNLLTPNLIKLLITPQTETVDLNPPSDVNLRRLRLSKDIIGCFVSYTTMLRQLDLSRCDGLTKDLFDDLMKHPQLAEINIDFEQAVTCQLITLENIQLAAQLSRGKIRINVVSLNLNGIKLTDTLRKNLCLFLQATTRLRYLGLCKSGIDGNTIELLAVSLKINSSIQRLEMNGNKLGDNGITVLCDNLMRHPSLQEFMIEDTSIGAEGAKAIRKLLSVTNCIVSLSLQNNPLNDNGVREIALGISENGKNKQTLKLSKLCLNQVGMRERGATKIANVLRLNCDTLTLVDFGYNSIGDYGADSFIQLVLKNGNIIEFKCYEIDASPEKIRELNAAVTRNQQFKCDVSQLELNLKTDMQMRPILRSNLPSEYHQLRVLRDQNAILRRQLSVGDLPETDANVRQSMLTVVAKPTVEISSLTNISPRKKDSDKVKNKIRDLYNLLKKAGYIIQVLHQSNAILFRVSNEPNDKLPSNLMSFWHNIIKSLGTLVPVSYEISNNQLRLSKLSEGRLEFLKLLNNELGIIIQEHEQALASHRQFSSSMKTDP